MARIPVVEIVVVRRLCHKVLRAGSNIEPHQRVGIELLGLPQPHDVLVAELGRVTNRRRW